MKKIGVIPFAHFASILTNTPVKKDILQYMAEGVIWFLKMSKMGNIAKKLKNHCQKNYLKVNFPPEYNPRPSRLQVQIINWPNLYTFLSVLALLYYKFVWKCSVLLTFTSAFSMGVMHQCNSNFQMAWDTTRACIWFVWTRTS